MESTIVSWQAGDDCAKAKAAEELAPVFMLLAERLARTFKFAVDRDDAIQEGVLTCLQKLHKFNPESGSKAFNYYTTIILNHWRQLYRSKVNYSKAKEGYLQYLCDTNKGWRLDWEGDKYTPKYDN